MAIKQVVTRDTKLVSYYGPLPLDQAKGSVYELNSEDLATVFPWYVDFDQASVTASSVTCTVSRYLLDKKFSKFVITSPTILSFKAGFKVYSTTTATTAQDQGASFVMSMVLDSAVALATSLSFFLAAVVLC